MLAISPLKENVLDEAAFAAAVKALATAHAARKGKDAALILPDFSTRITVLDFDSFPADAEEQLALIRFRLKRSVPFDVESAAVSYFAQPAAEACRRGGGDGAARNRLAFRSAVSRGGVESGAGDHVVAGGAGTGAGGRADHDRQAHRAGRSRCWCATRRRSSWCAAWNCRRPNWTILRAVLAPTFVYMEDNLGGRAEKLLLCGFGARTDEAKRHFEQELAVEVDELRSPLGVPGEHNAGLLGYLRSVARNN